MTQPGTAGTSGDPLEDIQTELLALDGVDIDTLVALCFDSADQPTALRFDGTGSSSGFFDGSAVAVVNGSVKSLSGAEYVDPSGTSHTLDSWQRGAGTVLPIAWETASDWDAAASESGVVHESVTNADHDDDTTVKMGYSATSPPASTGLRFYYPLHEDSGTTANDFSGNANDGSISNGTANQTGILGTTGFDFANTGSINAGVPTDGSEVTEYTVVMWLKVDSINSNNDAIYQVGISGMRIQGGFGGSGYVFRNQPQGLNPEVSGNVTTGSYQLVAVRWSKSLAKMSLVIDGTEVDTFTGENSGASVDRNDSGDFIMVKDYDGTIAETRFYRNHLSVSQLQTLYDVVDAESSITSGTKAFPSSVTPDLQNLSYSLNGESITIDVIGSPGTASEEVVTQSLGGATSYALSWSNSHTDFRVRPNLSTADPTVTPTISKIELGP